MLDDRTLQISEKFLFGLLDHFKDDMDIQDQRAYAYYVENNMPEQALAQLLVCIGYYSQSMTFNDFSEDTVLNYADS